MGLLDKLFGGGKSTNFKQMERYFNLMDEMNRKNRYGLFGGWEWRQGPDGNWGQHQTINPALEAGRDRLMGTMGSPYEGYSSPTALNALRDSRIQHQFERMNMEMPRPPLGEAGGMPGSMGPSQLPAGPMPGPGMPGPPAPGGPAPQPPQMPGPPGPQPPGAGMPQAPRQMGPPAPPQQMGPPAPPQQMGPPAPAQQGPAWANNQRFDESSFAGRLESGIDDWRRRQEEEEGDRGRGLMSTVGRALMGF